MSAETAAGTAPTLSRDRQTALYRRALKTLPGGTDSNFRAWGDDTIYVDRGKGGRVWDIDGNEFVDLRMGYGPVILGHNDERVDDYVNERMRLGVSFSLTSEDEVRAMELVKELTGWVDQARMTVSGTEATMHAMRIARGYTGREKIVKFEGQYHGVHDYALISVSPNDMSELGDADNPVRLAWGRGIPSAVADTIIPARYNNIEFLRRLFEREGDQIAAVIVEPVLGNAQAIMPKAGFHQAMRALTEEFGILLIFDEVKTGFRLARGGAAEFFGVKPDLATFAKAMGNGYPAAAFGGRRGSHERPARQGQPRWHVRGQSRRGRGRGPDARDPARHRRPRDRPRGRPADAGRPPGDPQSEGPAVRLHRPSGDVRDHVHRHRAVRVPRLGEHRPRAVRRDRDRDDGPWRDARAGLARAVVHVRGPCPGRHRRRGAHRVQRLARCRARGARAPGSRTPRHERQRNGRDGAEVRRMNGPGGMVLDGNAVRSVDRAAALLLALGESQGEAGVTELARRLGLHKSTASRLLATLQKRGLVEQDDETGKYRLGLVVIRLAERAERTLDLRGIALPELERLARLTHETTGLGILDGDSLLAVAQVDGPNLIAVGDWTGRATPLHCVASGKVLLSSLAEREVLRIVRRGLVSYTERTIVELEPLLEELARIRRRGYATAIGEYELGLNAVAAPVHDARGNVIAAVDIWGPAFRVTPRRVPELAVQAREAAAAISVRLGGVAPDREPPRVVHAPATATA